MKKKTISVSKTHTPTKKLLYWSLIVFLIKILIIVNISIVNFMEFGLEPMVKII